MTITGRSESSLRDSESTSKPSTFVIRRSVTTASNISARRRAMASWPEATGTASYPRSASPSAMVRAISTLSSTTMTLGLDIRAPFDWREQDRGPRSARLDVGEHQPAAMVGDDLVRDREPQTRAAVAALGGEEWFERASHVSQRDPAAGVCDGDLELAVLRLNADDDFASTFAGIAGVQEEVHDRVLEEPRIAHDRRHRRIDRVMERNSSLRESVVDEVDGVLNEHSRIDPLGGRGLSPRESQEPPDDLVDALRLREDRLDAGRETFIGRHLGHHLFCPRGDHAQRCRDLVSDAHGERSHDGGLVGSFQTFIAALLNACDRELALEHQLLALGPHREAAEGQDKSGRREDAQNQAAPRPELPVPVTLGAGNGDDVPCAAGAAIDGREPGERGARREAKRSRLLAGNANDRLARSEGFDQPARRKLPSVRCPKCGLTRTVQEDREAPRMLDGPHFGQNCALIDWAPGGGVDSKRGAQGRRESALLLREVL